jgi:putative SOS response-associated peptidase YedK
MAPLHHRMPVVVGPRGWPAWLAEAEANPATLLGPPPVSEPAEASLA